MPGTLISKQIMSMHPKQSELTYRIIEYGIEHGIIVKQNLIDALQISDIDQQYIQQVLEVQHVGTVNSNHIMILVSTGASSNPRDFQYRILPTALHNYNEYIELKEARKQAQESKTQSTTAIIISIMAFITSLIVGGIQIYLQVEQMPCK